MKENSKIIASDVFVALKSLEGNVTFDYIFMDPPYNQQLEKQVLIYLTNSSLITKSSVIIVEASFDTEFDYLKELGFEIIKRKEYKTNMHIFIELEKRQA